MTPRELHAIAVALNGRREYGAQKRLAELLGVVPFTVRRWLSGSPIPKPTQRLIHALSEQSEAK